MEKETPIIEPEDTEVMMPWEAFLEVCSNNGFVEAYREKQPRYSVDSFEEEEILLVNGDTGCILYAFSDQGKEVLGNATLWGEVKELEGVNYITADKRLEEFSSSRTDAGTIQISLEANDGMISKLAQLDGVFSFVIPWSLLPDLNLITPNEQLMPGVEYEEDFEEKVINEKLDKLSKNAKKVMGITRGKTKRKNPKKES